jgi:hypothetical protein
LVKSIFGLAGLLATSVMTPALNSEMTVPSFWALALRREHRRHAAASRHVLNDDRRLAGQMLGEEGSDGAGVGVVAAAGTRSHDDPDGLAGIEPDWAAALCEAVAITVTASKPITFRRTASSPTQYLRS